MARERSRATRTSAAAARPGAPSADSRRPPPASGAWREGDPPGRRQFLSIATDRPFALEGGGLLSDITLAYETWGTLSSDASNAVLVCHALTGDSHVAGPGGGGHPSPGWWDGLVGPDRALDPHEYFIVCVNTIGGCQGSTGPSSTDPATGRPYGSRFPIVSIRDMVRTQAAVADHLGISSWLCVVGGSMGGMQVLEWGVMYPERCRSIVPVATTVAATAQQIAYSSIERNAIALDPNWRGGDYYDAPPGEGPHRGLALARSLGQVTYRTDDVFNTKFGRKLVEDLHPFAQWQRFDVEGYLDYHGDRLVRRFDANSCLLLSKSMDLHDLARGRGGVEAALRRIRCPVRTMSITSDTLYPAYQQHLIRDVLQSLGVRADDVSIDSPQGHDAFLIDTDQVGAALRGFLHTLEGRHG